MTHRTLDLVYTRRYPRAMSPHHRDWQERAGDIGEKIAIAFWFAMAALAAVGLIAIVAGAIPVS